MSTRDGCHCTGAESIDCTEVCPFAGGSDDDDLDYEED